ncbi:MAG: MSMEG_6728 family protein [Syntrophobacteraceae bacterium]
MKSGRHTVKLWREGLNINTFLPYPSFSESARVLDGKRLGKQRIEVLQILRSLAGESRGWRNHPAVRMWRGYARTLAVYGIEMCAEWKRRGYRDATAEKILEILLGLERIAESRNPPWLGDRAFHLSHQSNLVRKNPDHYRGFFPEVPDDLPYIWPA